jgi:hypothetical protein
MNIEVVGIVNGCALTLNNSIGERNEIIKEHKNTSAKILFSFIDPFCLLLFQPSQCDYKGQAPKPNLKVVEIGALSLNLVR